MSLYLTGNSVPSASIPDVNDNAQNLDFALNDITSSFWTDRLGRQRTSWFGLESAFTVKLSDFESRFTTQIVGQEATFDASQADKENRFQEFLVSSGYVFLGDYEDGPFQFGARNQYIRYDNQYYRLNAATDIGFTTTGTDTNSFANDVAHFVLMDGDTLRQNLGSSELPGASLVALDNGNVADAILYKTPEMFGAKGDGTTDDTAAIQSAANWLCAASNRNLIFSSGKLYRLTAPVTFTFLAGVKCCAIEMHGAIKPDGGVGDAFTINDAVGCDFKLNVLGDGVSISIDGTTGEVTLPDGFPDYSSSEPSGSQQAFVFNSCRSVRIDAVGYGYAGRVLRTKSTRSLKTSFLDISLRTGDSATVIGSGQCGQAMYLEGGSDAFGIINIAQTNWDVYGSVVYKLADLSIAYWENGSGYTNASMTFIGCQTVHAGIIASGGVNQRYPSVVISDTSDRPTIGFSIQRLFCVTGNNNLVLEGLGSDDALRKSVTINSFYSIQAADDGVVINGMSNAEINNVHIDDVQTGIRIKGLVRNVRISGYIKNPVNYGIISDSDAEIHEFYFNGRILAASSTLDCVNFTAGNILTATFRDCYIFATQGAFNLPSSNDVRIIGGSHSAVTMFPGSRPAIIKDTSGFISAKRGRVSFPVGSLTGDTLIVNHGLSLAPTSVTLTPLGAVSGANLSISTSDGLTFTVTYTGPTLSTIFEFWWRADCELV